VNGRLPNPVAPSRSSGRRVSCAGAFVPQMAPRQRVLQILVKYRLFEIGEKTRLIHLEYRQKARSAENQRFKPCC
jgi:hypothetical protein